MSSKKRQQIGARLFRFALLVAPVFGLSYVGVELSHDSFNGNAYIASLLSSFSLLGVGVLGAYLLLYRPLARSLLRDTDPLASQKAAPAYPSWGFSVVRQFLTSAHDARLQREAFGRLTEAYRSLSQLDQGDLTIKKAMSVPVHTGLAKSVTPYALDLNEVALVPLGSPRDLSAQTNEAVIQSVGGEQLEFQHEGEYWLAIPLPRHDSRFIVLRVEPRQLWSRLPKIYRRFFSTLGSMVITHILSRSPKHAPDGESTSPPTQASQTEPPIQTAASLVHAEHSGMSKLDPAMGDKDPDGAPVIVASGPKKALAIIDGQFRADLHSVTHAVGYTQRAGMRFSGDFIALSFDTTRQHSMLFLGHIPGGRADNSLAASGALALLAEHLSDNPLPSHELAESEFRSLIDVLHRFSFKVFGGNLGVCLTAIEFSHKTEKGRFATFGLPFPFLVSPDERKPLLLSPRGSGSGMLGLSEESPHFQLTPFSLLPGQLIFSCTSALLNLRNATRRSFEKELVRGRLSAINEAQFKSTARSFADHLVWLAERHNNNSFLNEDLSLVVIGPRETFKGN